MSNLTDSKPVACGGAVLRRTNSHIVGNSKVAITRSGDRHLAPPIRNFALTTTPDNDPMWGNHCIQEEIIVEGIWIDTDVWNDLDDWEE